MKMSGFFRKQWGCFIMWKQIQSITIKKVFADDGLSAMARIVNAYLDLAELRAGVKVAIRRFLLE